MDDLERRLKSSLTTLRDEGADSYGRTTWEARAEALERIRARRTRRYLATSAVAVAALAAIFYVVARPAAIDRADDLPLTGTPTNAEGLNYLVPVDVTAVGDGPRDLAVGGRGLLWTANSDSTVSPIDETGAELDRFPVPSEPGDIAIAQGPVWVALPEDGTVVEIDPQQGALDPIEVFAPTEAAELTVGDDVLWVVARGESLVAMDVATRVPEEVDLADAPLDVAIHGANAWVLSADGSVVPVDQATRTALDPRFQVPPSSNGDLTYAGGALWYFTGEDESLTRLDPATGEESTTSLDGVVVDLAIDPEVAWALLRRDDGTSWLQRVDRSTGLGRGPAQPIVGEAAEMAIAHGSLWITLTDRDEVARFPKS